MTNLVDPNFHAQTTNAHFLLYKTFNIITMQNTESNLTITVNKLLVSYTDKGSDKMKSIILIHGFPFNKSMWKNQIEALKDNVRVITYDIRGHGNTNNGSEAYSIELFVNDLIGLMDALQIDKTIIGGLSMGGYIALSAIEKYPERFHALVLSDTSCFADTPETIAHRLRTIEIIESGTIGKFADESLKKFFAAETFASNTSIIESVRDMMITTSKPSLCSTLLALAERKETCSQLSEIKVPVLIMVGKEDQITPPEVASFLFKNITNSSLHIIENAGHVSNMEKPGEFNDQLKRFLLSLKPVGQHEKK